MPKDCDTHALLVQSLMALRAFAVQAACPRPEKRSRRSQDMSHAAGCELQAGATALRSTTCTAQILGY